MAIAEGVARASGLYVDLKWPNDVYVGRRKLGGILAEAGTTGGSVERVILGYGLNIRQSAYPADVADRATSLETELGVAVDRETVLRETLAALARRWDDLVAGKFDDILDAWRALAPNATGARVVWMSGAGAVAGVTDGIYAAGDLGMRVGDRVERIVAGEVVWK